MVALTPLLYVVLLVAALATVGLGRSPGAAPARRPVVTIVAVLVVGIPTLLQLTVRPGLLDLLERDWTRIERGQVWRLVTALVVQDGGVTGAAFNLLLLAVVGRSAEQVWSRGRWLVIALGAGLGGEFWGAVVQPVGAGSSVAVFGLAASLAVHALRHGGRRQRILAVVSLAVGLVLLLTRDLHGGAAAIGALLGFVLDQASRPVTPSGSAPT